MQIDRRRASRMVLVLLAGVVVLAVAVASATASAKTDPTLVGVTAVDGAGHRLPVNPKVKPGEHLTIRADGFQPSASVEVRALDGTLGVTADSSGIATYSFTVPLDIDDGSHVIRLIGAPDLRGDESGVQGNVDVVVPRLANFPFRTGRHGPNPTPSHSVGGTHAGSGGGPLAGTGRDIAAGLVAAALLVALGAVIVGTGRRGRRTRPQ